MKLSFRSWQLYAAILIAAFCLTLVPSKQTSFVKANCLVKNLPQASKNFKAIQKNFNRIKALSERIPHSTSTALLHLDKNRHQWLLPFDYNRTGRHLPNFYLSASDVITPEQNYVVAQAPLPTTLHDFWLAVLECKPSLIVTLANAIEDGIAKAFPYWETRDPFSIDNWVVARTSSLQIIKEVRAARLCKREFQCINNKTKEERTITHLHYENWPDNGIPDASLFVELITHAHTLTPVKKVPVLVHCSGGVGRSGTFVTALTLYKRLLHQKQTLPYSQFLEIELNIPQTVYELRLQRQYMVATSRQLQAIYELLAQSLL